MNKCLIAGKEKAGSPCSTDCSCKQGKHRHNALVEHYIASLNENKESFLMLSPGRNPQEKALVLVQDGAYKGFGFADSVAQSDTLIDYIKPFPHTRLFGNVIGSFIDKKGYEVRELG
ncbi:MAG: hypothetical protein EXR21_03830 [Flavobacteriaceae bacterium]|nr:hypothetical protein [Flavobacteriaceae bacterium]